MNPTVLRFQLNIVSAGVAISLVTASDALAMQAQSDSTAKRRPLRNVVRTDWLGWAALNAHNQAFATSARFAWPHLITYERAVTERASLSAELLFDAWSGKQHRSGGSVGWRYYIMPSERADRFMSGMYAETGLNYRKLRGQEYWLSADSDWITAYRAGATLRLGWQICFGKGRVRYVSDNALGLGLWLPLGEPTSSSGQPVELDHSSGFMSTGPSLSLRGGIGLQF
ncbi:hypothetical protein [Hymenobacter latericus]|uniref:hypothetical protein n=1 Tax=Hymenobacter sp. YIM 151858-1 TaxID=2987688 RepID=UPI002226BF2C|nr:hypothetical protein [Hymenobacter sp. YIM 151858-1]UYZ58554.1 hypothetical protein OIS50_16020 [Hymenobacter sp. YIM 151858-1]